MTVKEWMEENFFKSGNAFDYKTESGEILTIQPEDEEKYEVVSFVEGVVCEINDIIVVRER